MNKKRRDYNTDGAQTMAFPKHIIALCRRLPLIKHLYINRMGYFPQAVDHSYSREAGKFAYAVLLHCYDGEGWISVNGKKTVFSTGDAFLFPPYSAHSYGASPEKPWSIFWMHLSGNLTGDVVDAFGTKTREQPLRTVYSEERVQLFYQIFSTLSKGFSIPNLLYANLTLPHYLASFIAEDSFHGHSAAAVRKDYVDDAIVYMQRHLQEQLSVELLAGRAEVSSSVFFRKFKKSTGYTPIAYFNFLKIQRAIQLIHTRHYTISEIGAKIGIDDAYYFSRLFKKQMGVSPRQYINEFIYQVDGRRSE